MAITEYLKNILSAKYGEEVRSSIYNALLEAYENGNFDQQILNDMGYLKLIWEQGTLNSGGESDNSKAIRTSEYTNVSEINTLYFKCPSDIIVYVCEFSSTEGDIRDRMITIGAGGGIWTKTSATCKYVRFIATYVDTSNNITPDIGSEVTVQNYLINDLYKQIQQILNDMGYLKLIWEQGTLNSGGESDNSKAIRTSEYTNVSEINTLYFKCPSDIIVYVCEFSSTEGDIRDRMITIGAGGGIWTKTSATCKYVRFIATYVDTSNNITPDIGSEVTVQSKNNYEMYFLESTNDQSDRSNEILDLLLEKGICRLDSGVFYISPIDMPVNSQIIGSGNSTKIILINSETNKYALKMNSNCIIKNLQLDGLSQSIPNEAGDISGILWNGNEPVNGLIDSILIQNFIDSGIKMEETGYGMDGVNLSNIAIKNCFYGINIPKHSEYHRFTNCKALDCHYGCLNNGGNNMFLNCNFSGNIIGFAIYNTAAAPASNNSHGSAIGCMFNHEDDNNGLGIDIEGATSGFVFSSGQMFYGNIRIKNSVGIQIKDFNFGNDVTITIEDSGNRLTLIDGCVFGNSPSIIADDATNLKITNSWQRDGTQVEYI